MKIKLTGNTDTSFEKITWDDLPPCEKHGKTLECGTFKGRYQEMLTQNACINMMGASTREEILKIWSEMDRWHDGYTPIQFWPNPECYKKGQESNIVKLEINQENEGDIKAMNKCLYGILRNIAYNEEHHLGLVNTTLMKWAKGLKKDIEEGIEKTPVSEKEYIQVELESIWDEVEKYSIVNISFKTLVEEELKSIKRGKDLISGKELIQDKYYIIEPNHIIHEFLTYVFMYRIIGHDIAQIMLELESGKFFPATPDTQAPDKKSKSTTDVSYKWLSNPDEELPALYDKMKKVGLIAPETPIEQFTAIFTGQPIDSIEPVKWDKGPTLLAYFIYQIVFTHQKTPTTNSHWKVGALCFTRTVKKFTSDILRSSLTQSYDGHTKWPKNHEWIDNLFENH